MTLAPDQKYYNQTYPKKILVERFGRFSVIDLLPRIVIKVDIKGMEEAIIGALIDFDLRHSKEVICFTERWAHALKVQLKKDLSGRILLQTKNQMKWHDLREISNLKNAIKLCICNANLPKQDALKFCK